MNFEVVDVAKPASLKSGKKISKYDDPELRAAAFGLPADGSKGLSVKNFDGVPAKMMVNNIRWRLNNATKDAVTEANPVAMSFTAQPNAEGTGITIWRKS